MKKVLLVLGMLTTLLFSTTLATFQARAHIGEQATVCGVVYGGYYARSSRGRPTFINLDGAYPNQKFTIVIWGDDRHKFRSPERRYQNKKICVKGVIESYRGVPQIIVSERSQIVR